MATWIPTNKRTKQPYPAVDDAEKERMEKYTATAGKFTFQLVADPKTAKPANAPAPAPEDSKKHTPAPPVA